MINLRAFAFFGAILAAVTGAHSIALANDYFVSRHGNDANSGSTREAAFASIQKGVNSLQSGDTLTVSPGEYFESVKRIDLGNTERDTLIRAEIPGTVVLRGDMPAPAFRPLAGHRFVYVADFNFAGNVPAVNEIDTLTILKRMPNASELEFIPGTFYHDAGAGKLYVAASDMKPPQAHHYTVSVIPTHGIHLVRPRRVIVDGFVVTGYSAMGLLHYREETAGGVWGIFIANGKNCVIRNCHAYLNAWGIGINSGAPGSGDNTIERCVAWANKSAFANGDMGGLTVFAARRDAIRGSTAYLNGMYGINIYGTGGAPPNGNDGGNDPKNRSILASNFAWGNETADIKIKTGYEYFHVAENCVSPGHWSVLNVTRGLIGRGSPMKTGLADDIILTEFAGLDVQREFADPDNHDYRLQSTSRFRRKGTAGSDCGPFPYAPNVFYVNPAGDDSADGLSTGTAWKTLARAVRNLHAGDTLYLAPGSYSAGLDIQAQGQDGSAISVRGRGTGGVTIHGAIRLKDSSRVRFERLCFCDPVSIEKAREIAFENCQFTSTGTSLTACDVHGLAVSHCAFTAFEQAALAATECSQIDLSGSLYDNAHGAAVQLAAMGMVRYSNYNNYRNAAAAWTVAAKPLSLADVRKLHDEQSQEMVPEFDVADGLPRLNNAPLFAAGGPMGKPFGPYRDEMRRRDLTLIAPPIVHSLSATTANLEWTTSLPATCHLAWGETPACERSATFNVNSFGTYSLTGLKPGQTYFFRIKAIEIPTDMLPKSDAKPIELNDAPISFTTLKRNAAPAVYYVASEGDDARSGLDRKSAWKTIAYAAATVNAGDTVLIAGGKYSERIRVRATGETDRPITFRSLPGERVDIDGGDMVLNSAFVAGGKSHLRFDGFYLSHFNLFPNDGWSLQYSGEFHLYDCKDIEISRCFSEGRGGYSAGPVTAFNVDGLRIKNCVNTYKFGGMYFWRCPNLVVQNTVFAEPMIMAYVLRNLKTQKATMENCIFTDMLDKKARLNIGILCCDGEMDGFVSRDDCYFLRDCIPLEQRAIDGKLTIAQLGPHLANPLFANPQFAGDPGVVHHPEDKSGFSPDRMMDSTFKVDFDSFFAKNPEVIKRGMGLQPEAFKDFHFVRQGKAIQQ